MTGIKVDFEGLNVSLIWAENCYDQGDYEGAIQQCKDALEDNLTRQQKYQCYSILVGSYAELNDIKSSSKYFWKAFKIKPIITSSFLIYSIIKNIIIRIFRF